VFGPRGTPFVLVFFNRYLTEGLKPKTKGFINAETNAKQKKIAGTKANIG